MKGLQKYRPSREIRSGLVIETNLIMLVLDILSEVINAPKGGVTPCPIELNGRLL